jgi:hypothetical protein
MPLRGKSGAGSSPSHSSASIPSGGDNETNTTERRSQPLPLDFPQSWCTLSCGASVLLPCCCL